MANDVSISISVANAANRMPSGFIPGAGSVYFHQKGSSASLKGSFCVDDDSTGPPANTCTDGDGFAEQNLNIKVDVPTSPTGVVQRVGKKARFGLMMFNSTASGTDGGKLMADVGSPVGPNGTQEDMVNAIAATNPNAGTPLAESLYEATRYFAQVPPAYSNSDYTDNVQAKDPYYFQPGWSSPAQYVKCCKSFVIVFTDGEPTADLRIPPSMKDAGHAAVGHGSTHATGTNCSGAAGCTGGVGGVVGHTHASHPTLNDGHHDVCSNYYGGESSDSCKFEGSHYLDDVAFWAHTHDLRPTGTLVGIGNKSGTNVVDGDETGKPLDGFQNITVYTFMAFGTGSNILKDTAKGGGFDDKNGNLLPDNGLTGGAAGPCLDHIANPGRPCEWDKYNNISGAAVPDGVPDTYFFSQDADDLQDRLLAAINSILQRSASGTAASVLANSSTGEGAVYQSYFYPRTVEGARNVDWTGYVEGYWIDGFGNMREDASGTGGTGSPDGRLVYEHDRIIKMKFDTALNKVIVERYSDLNGDGKADTPATPDGGSVELRDISGIWEGGRRLALRDASARSIYTWADLNNDGVVDSGERLDFTQANVAKLRPYLYEPTGTTIFTAENVIDFVRGCEPATCSAQLQLRDRVLTVKNDAGTAVTKTWKLGDAAHSTPTVVGAPKERYDILYGDSSYTKFFQDYKDRRNVLYIGANDGMLHAFNGGFYNRGDKSGTTELEHGYFTTQRVPPLTAVASTPPLGEELWGFIPMQLLPHLRWLAQADYAHVQYVDLKPKVTDVRIFCDSGSSPIPGPGPSAPNCVNGQDSVAHPNGWGTILIGGFRMGGSCGDGNCVNTTSGAVKTMKYTRDFTYPANGNTTDADDTRTFLSAYFVLDITNPEYPPKLLWSFTHTNMGFTTSYPAVLRVKPACTGASCKSDHTDAQWFAVFGSGPTNYAVDVVAQGPRMYAFDLLKGPGAFTSSGSNVYTATTTKAFGVNQTLGGGDSGFMGDMATVDADLDYRVDVAYAGSLYNDGSLPWRGKMYRLTTPCSGTSCSVGEWGVDWSGGGATRVPTELLDNFTSSAGTLEAGPVTAGVTVTKDDANQMWVFWGTGRFYGPADRTLEEQEYFFGVKDRVLSGSCAQVANDVVGCKSTNLVDVSSAQVCVSCSPTTMVSGVSEGAATPTQLLGSSATTTLQGLVQSKHGWFTKLPQPIQTPAVPSRERVLVSPTLVGGIVFFPTFVPQNDMCTPLGDGYLYGLFYATGSAYQDPVLGTSSVSGNTVSNRYVSLGQGQTAQLGVHIGAQGTGAGGGGTGGTGCAGSMSVLGQTSTGAITSTCVKTLSAWSRYLSWNNQRD